MRRHTRVRHLALAPILFALPVGAASPARADALDSCTVIVSGTDMRSRPGGLAQCLGRVLVKVSGDPTLSDDPRVATILETSDQLLEDFVYFDRMSGMALHDEQGTRDRPFDLKASFDPKQVDAILTGLGRQPWRGTRPALVASVAVSDRTGHDFTLSADGLEGEPMRQAILAAGERFGMRIILLPEPEPVGGAPAPVAPAPTEAAVLKQAGQTVHSQAIYALMGRLRWSDVDFGWVATWQLPGSDSPAWKISGVSFDEAFRDGVGGATHILAAQAASPDLGRPH